jgi:hypothetical protein
MARAAVDDDCEGDKGADINAGFYANPPVDASRWPQF